MARILIIDDDEMVRHTLKSILSAAGHDVIVSRNGKEGACILASSEEVVMMITDIIMPEQEGIETIVMAKKTKPKLKIIAISGGGRIRNLDFLSIAKQVGADEILKKPFRAIDLLQLVDGCLSADQHGDSSN